jgi:small subunit ribosomal protein S9
MAQPLQYLGVGRRKTAIARVYLRPGAGQVSINGRQMEDYFSVPILRQIAIQPFQVTETLGKFDLKARLTGGGTSAQAQALRHGVARALLKFNAELRPKLKSAGFLTRDPREVERKKYGRAGARRRFQFSKR